jgi:hypothetical protein
MMAVPGIWKKPFSGTAGRQPEPERLSRICQKRSGLYFFDS